MYTGKRIRGSDESWTPGEIKTLIGPLFDVDPAEDFGFVIVIERRGYIMVRSNLASDGDLQATLRDTIEGSTKPFEDES